MNVRRRTVHGFVWSYAAFGGDKVLSLATTMILTRALLPEDFGTVATAMLVVTVIDAFRDLGLRDALTYADGGRDAADTAFLINVGFGLVQTAAAFLLAPVVAHWVGNAQVEPIIAALAPVFLFNTLGATHDALLQKRLAFTQCCQVDLAAAAVRTAITLAGILAGLGIWSIVAGFLAGAAGRAGGRWLVMPWRPRLRFDPARARSLLAYGMHVSMVAVAGPLLGRIDQIAIIAFLNETALGFYTVALRLPEVMLGSINIVVSRIMFPVYVHITDASQRLECLFTTMRGMLVVIAPAALGMAVVAPEVLPLVFGGQWTPSVPLLQVFAMIVLVDTVPWTIGDALKAMGRPNIISRLMMFEAAVTAPLIWFATQSSRHVVVVAGTLLACRIIASAVRLAVAARVLRFSAWRYAQTLGGVAVSGLGMVVGLLAWREFIADQPPLVLLASSVPLGAVLYLAGLWLTERTELKRWRQLLSSASEGHQEDAVGGARRTP